MNELELLLIQDLQFTELILQGFLFGGIISGTTLILSQAINYGIKLLHKS